MPGVNDPVPPFDATVAGVKGLLPHAEFPETPKVGQKTVTQSQVQGFVEDVTGRVLARVGGWDELDADHQATVKAAARDVVHNGAASYTQAARFPEQADKEADNYAEVLWQRYLDGLDQLAALVATWLGDADPDGSDNLPVGAFPAAAVTELTGF